METSPQLQQLAPNARLRAAVSVRVQTAPVVAMEAMKEVLRSRYLKARRPGQTIVLNETPTQILTESDDQMNRYFIAVKAEEICAGETRLLLEQWTEPGAEGPDRPRVRSWQASRLAGRISSWAMLRDARRRAEAHRRMHLLTRLSAAWLVLLVIGFANGTLREVLIKPWLGEVAARQLSAGTAVLLMTAAVWILWPWIGLRRLSHAVRAGLFWLVLTAAFETLILNRWVGRMEWRDILATYNVAAGELWPLVLLWIGLLPSIIYGWRGRAPLRH